MPTAAEVSSANREVPLKLTDVILHVFLPLLTQETAIMVSAFAYGLKTDVAVGWLIALNTLAVTIDIALFFIPTFFLSDRLHNSIQERMGDYYDRGVNIVKLMGAFRTATAMAFVMPSVAAMIVVGLLRLSFWRALAGLFVGSVAYVVVPLLIALPLASTLPAYLLPLLRWTAPAILLALVLLSLVRAGWRGLGRADSGAD